MIETNVYQAIFTAPVGKIGLRLVGEAVSALDYLSVDTPELPPVDAAARSVATELQAYFNDPRAPLTVVLAPAGTVFQQRVWRALRTIPPGTVLTYGELATRLGTAARAVGGACRSNPIPIFIPCHRVVARRGLGGYAGEVTGDPLSIKRWLLRQEGVEITHGVRKPKALDSIN